MSHMVSQLAMFAQDAGQDGAAPIWYEAAWFKVACVLAIFLVPLVLARALSSALRMRDYTTKFYIIFFAIAFGAFIVSTNKVRLALDLNGGTELIYELDQSKKDPDKPVDMNKMINALRQRIDPAGVKQVRIQAYGLEQVRITVPENDPAEIRRLKRQISQAGMLEFRILADPAHDGELIAQADKLRPNEMDVRVPPADADPTDPHAIALIAEAKKLTDKENLFRRPEDGAIAEWVAPSKSHEDKIKEGDAGLVTREVDGKPQVLIIRDRLAGRWVKGGMHKDEDKKSPTFGQIVPRINPEGTKFRARGDGGIDFLVVNDPLNVYGVETASAEPNPQGGWMVTFGFDSVRANKFGRLTQNNLPDEETNKPRLLGIVLDDELLSAPALRAVITSSGQITGRFTKDDTQWLASVLDAGSLPAALAEAPIREQAQSALLGAQTIAMGKKAITISFIAVMIFMPLYYRFSGLVAAFALTLNLLLVLAIMMLFKAAFSLPGLAGLVLTVGMAVDANVLIFERIREELNRGAALRMAIRNGFDRATRTIVDANVTTLITGIVLFAIGSEQIKGFATTLILGIAMSMFTAIFCSRVIFDVAEKRGWITQLNMMRLFGQTNFDFLGKRKLAACCSILLIGLGLFATFDRGMDMLALDFTGGSEVTVVSIDAKEGDEADLEAKLQEASLVIAEGLLPEGLTIDDYAAKSEDGKGPQTTFDLNARSNLDSVLGIGQLAYGTDAVKLSAGNDKYQVTLSGSVSQEDAQKKLDEAKTKYLNGLKLTEQNTEVTIDTETGENLIRISTSVDDVDMVRASATKAFAGRLKSNRLSYNKTSMSKIEAETPAAPADTEPAAPNTEETSQVTPQGDDSLQGPQAPKSIAALTKTPVLAQPAEESAEGDGEAATSEESTTEESTTETDAATETTESEDAAVEELQKRFDPPEESRPQRFANGTEVEMTFDIAVNQQTLQSYIEEVMRETTGVQDFQVVNTEVEEGQRHAKTTWQLRSGMDFDETTALLDAVAAKMEGQPVFPSANAMGGLVAGNQQAQAWGALLASLVFIVGYIWIRFQRVIYGLAAVVALVHDVLITLGMLALSGYLFQISFFHNVLLIDHFKISLEIMAAFLTIIGYSLNDTIVVFDRIREVRGKSPDLSAAMINKSVNQTLARTVLTSLTTLIVVAILYAMGGSGIHGFAFALVTGVLVGTYSSIFVASPVLLWLSKSGLAVPDDLVGEAQPAGAAAT